MATSKEAGFKPGDIATSVSAWRTIPSINPRGAVESGIPLDKPGANVDFTFYKVLELDVPHGAGTGTKLEVIESGSSSEFPHNPGDIVIIHSGFHNYITEGEEDSRLRDELRNAGFRLQAYTERDGSIKLDIVRVDKEKNS